MFAGSIISAFVIIKKKQLSQRFFVYYSTDAIADDAVRYQYVKKKGYVRLHTNKGDVNLELHCDKVMTLMFSQEQTEPAIKLFKSHPDTPLCRIRYFRARQRHVSAVCDRQ